MSAFIKKSTRTVAVLMVLATALVGVASANADWADETPMLRLGDEGELVERLQYELSAVSLYFGEINGVFDSATEASVKQLQTILSVGVDGIYGPITHAAYIAAVADGTLVPVYPSDRPLAGLVIGIDAGHQECADLTLESISPLTDGLKVRMTAGGVGVRTGNDEYCINLTIAMCLKAMLEDAGATVVMTRTDSDVSISNMERAELMNDAEVDFWVRIHCNSCADSSTYGARVLIPAGVANASKLCDSRRLGYCLINAFCAETGAPMLASHSLTDQTGFNWSDAPVVTIEMGYLSNAISDLKLSRTSYQDNCVRGLYLGIIDFVNGVDIPAINAPDGEGNGD